MEVSDQLQALATLHLGAESHMRWTQVWFLRDSMSL